MSNFTFTPVTVSRGRKFKGFGYRVSSYDSSFSVYAGRGGFIESYTARIWDPATKQIVKANDDFCVETPTDPAKVEADRQAYIKLTIESTIAWCRTKSPNEIEALKFARNVLRKHHPEMMEYIDQACPDMRDVSAEIENTLNWAAGLTTKACYMYGKWCAGGKPISVERKVRTAYRALQKKGVTSLENFNDCWELSLTLRGWLEHKDVR